MRYVWTCVIVMALGVTAIGCNKSPSGSSSSSSGGSGGGGAANKATPVAGTWLRSGKPLQLLGDEVQGIEFVADGKAMVYNGTGQSIQVTYSMLENGRLALTVMGPTEAFKYTLAGDALSLVPDDEPGHAYSFRKLSGQSVPEALRAERAEAAKHVQARSAALQTFVKQPNLVLSAGGDANAPRIALKDLGEGKTVAYFNTPTGASLREATVSVNGSANPAQVIVQLGNVLGPPGEPPAQQQESLTFTAAPDAPAGQVKLTSGPLALSSDESASKAIIAKYEQVKQGREAALSQFADAFGAFAHVEGELGNPGSTQRQKVGWMFLRVPKKPAFLVADVTRMPNPPPAAFNQQATVEFHNGRPVMNLQQRPFDLIKDGDKQALRGSYNSAPVTYSFVEVLSAEQMVQRKVAVVDFVRKRLNAGVSLSGRVWIDATTPYPEPVHLDLTSTDGQRVTGTAALLELDGAYAMAGDVVPTVLGVQLAMKSTGVAKQGRSTLFARDRQFTVDVRWDGGTERIGGKMVGFQAGELDLKETTDAQLQEDLSRVKKTLADGVTFTRIQPPPGDPARWGTPTLTLKLDGEQITGTMETVGGARPVAAAKIDGSVAIENGYVALKLNQAGGPRNYPPSVEYRFYSLFEDGVLRPTGWNLVSTVNPPNVGLMAFKEAKK